MGYIGRYTASNIVDLESPISVDGTTIIENGVLKNVGIDGIKLKSSGDSITKSDGTTAVLSESGGVVTLNNGTIGSGVHFPAGHVIQSKTSTLSSGFNFTIGGANNAQNNGVTDSDGTAATRADSSWGGIVDDLIVTLTKSSSSSYFLITYNIYISNSRMARAYNSYISLYSSVDSYADPISRGDASGNRKRVTGGFKSYYDASSAYDTNNVVHIGGQAKYSPSISSGTSLTIKPLVASTYNIAVYLNFNSSDGDNINHHRYVSAMTVQEIQGT